MPTRKSTKTVRSSTRRKARSSEASLTSRAYMDRLDALVSSAMDSGVSSGLVVGHLMVALERLAHELAESDGEGMTGPEMLASWLELLGPRMRARRESQLSH